MQTVWQRHAGTAMRFGLVGLSNTLIGFGGFRLFFFLFGNALVAQGIAYAVGTLWSFWLNSRWTFGAPVFSHAQLIRFVALQFCLMTTSAAAMGLAVDRSGLQPDLSWLTVMSTAAVVNYLLTRNWVFSPRDSEGT